VRHNTDTNTNTNTDSDAHSDSYAHTYPNSYTDSDTYPNSHTDSHPDSDQQLPAVGAGQSLCTRCKSHEPWWLLSVQGSRMVLVDLDRV
jgi:hypothetical protein